MKCAVSVDAPCATISSKSYPLYTCSASLEVCRWKDGILFGFIVSFMYTDKQDMLLVKFHLNIYFAVYLQQTLLGFHCYSHFIVTL